MSKETKDIYFDGMIYVGVGEPESQWMFREVKCLCNSCKEYDANYLAGLTNYPVQGNHSFKDGQTIVEGIDYELDFAEDSLDLNADKNGNNWTKVAIPLPSLSDAGREDAKEDLVQKNIDFAAERVADTIFYHFTDATNKEKLKTALKTFANIILLATSQNNN